LYLQWKQFHFPVLVDALNALPYRVMPVPMGIDQNGIVRKPHMELSDLESFLDTSYPDRNIPDTYNIADPWDVASLREKARRSGDPEDWRKLGDVLFYRNDPQHLKESVNAYRRAIELGPEDGSLHFRLGVVLRRMYERGISREGTAQKAVKHWERALQINPKQYIWRRWLQQYGPRSDQPYNFYSWIDKARTQIRQRGEEPISLEVEPPRANVASQKDNVGIEEADAIPDPDPEGDIMRDRAPLVEVSPLATPVRVRPGSEVRVRVTCALRSKRTPYWNNEATPLTLSVDLPDGVTLVEGRFRYPNERQPETRGDRLLEFTISISDTIGEGKVKIPGYVLYNVCEKKTGICRYLRQDLSVSFVVDQDAPELKR
jgi:hypothetical protein